MGKVIDFYETRKITLPIAVAIVKDRLSDDSISLETKTIAINMVAEMETHNSISKDNLIGALKFLFDNYDF